MSKRKKRSQKNSTTSTTVAEAFGDYVDPTEYLTDTPGWNVWFGGPSVAASTSSRDGGKNAPVFQTDSELSLIRGSARFICDVSPTARCALMNLTNYSIGSGFKYSVVDRTDEPVIGAVKKSDLAVSANSIINEFLDRTKYGTSTRRKKLLHRFRRDGEYFLVLYHTGAGRATYRLADPGFVMTPVDSRSLDDAYPIDGPSDWTFGVHTPYDDYETRHGYYLQYSESVADYEYVEESRMVHARANVDEEIKRGLSDFYWVYTALGDASKLLRNGMRGATVLSSIAAIVEHPTGVTESQVNSFKTANQTRQYTKQTQSGGRTQTVSSYAPGSVLHTPAGTSYKPSPLASQGVADSIIALDQAALRIIGSNWCMPEYMISGDASNANYSSTLVAESPFVKFIESIQSECVVEDIELLWKVLGIANMAGRFARGIRMDEIKSQIEIKVDAKSPNVRNMKEEAEGNRVLFDAGIMSARTWATKAGLDYDQEMAHKTTQAGNAVDKSVVSDNQSEDDAEYNYEDSQDSRQKEVYKK